MHVCILGSDGFLLQDRADRVFSHVCVCHQGLER
jgi:hypothetical protein